MCSCWDHVEPIWCGMCYVDVMQSTISFPTRTKQPTINNKFLMSRICALGDSI